MSMTFRWSADCSVCKELVVTESGSIATSVIGVSMPSYSESLCISVVVLVVMLMLELEQVWMG
jgi:hypothetical protein